MPVSSYANPIHAMATKTAAYVSHSGAAALPLTHNFVIGRRWLTQKAFTTNWQCENAKYGVLHAAFDMAGQASQHQGIPMREILPRGIPALSQMIARGNEPVFANLAMQTVSLRINWPGYGHVEWVRKIESGGMTRAQLAYTLAQQFSQFISCASQTGCTDKENAIGMIGFEHFVLVGFHHVYGGIWQADVAVDGR